LGTYLHGIFTSTAACQALLTWAGLDAPVEIPDYQTSCNTAIDRLADCVEQYLDTAQLNRLLDLDTQSS
jgi:adenosylcobyric acid synthase